MPTVLITGANRGIGAKLTELYLQRGYTVVAAVRDPATMKPAKDVVVVKLDASSTTDAKEAVEELKTKYGVTSLDIVIANAAIHFAPETFKELSIADWQKTMEVNVRGPLILFQAVVDLLPPNKGKFVVISSGRGTIGQEHIKGEGAYGQSKAAVNYMVAKLHYEHPELVVLAISPGWVPTEMGLRGAKWSGKTETPQKLEQTCPEILKVIDSSTRETSSGTMTNWSGQKMPW